MSTSRTVDPILQSLNNKTTPSSSQNATTFSLLKAAFPDPSAAQQIYKEKLEYKPLSLNPTTLDARDQRRQRRLDKLHKKRKPKPLSAKEKRQLRIYDIPKSEIKYDKFLPLNKLWNNYISELIPNPATANTSTHAPTLLKADYHGADITVESCRCKERIGLHGICVKETKNLFEIVTKEDRLVKIPKEKTLFRVTTEEGIGKVEWRVWGDQVLSRSGERAGKKFGGKTIRGKPLLEL